MFLFDENYIHSCFNEISDVYNFSVFINSSKNMNTKVFILRGRKMKSWEMLFNEFSSALQFPYYFGENLNAFDDCMSDLEWISEDNIIIFIDEWCSVLRSSEEDKRIFLNHIVENEKYLEASSEKKKLRTVLLFSTEEESISELKSIDVMNCLNSGLMGRI